MQAVDRHCANVVLRALGNINRDGNVLFVQTIDLHVGNLYVRVSVVLVQLLDLLNIFIELLIVQAARSGNETENVIRLRLHYLTDLFGLEVIVTDESNRLDDRFSALAYRKGNARRTSLFIGLNLVLNIGIGKT